MKTVRKDFNFEEHVEENSVINIVLCGVTTVGKTALVTRYDKEDFDEEKDYRPTILLDTVELTKYTRNSDI